MFDIIKEGLKLNQSLAQLPFKAIRQLVDDKNTSAKQMVDVAEDFVSMPFVAASKALESSCRSCPAQTAAKKGQESCGGPTVKNIMVTPEVAVFSDVEIKPGERRALINVTGLLCGG